MVLVNLSLSHFRNQTRRSFEFNQKTLIIGPNSSGKSNLIEAIRFLSVGRSFRARRDQECIKFGQEVGRLTATLAEDGAKPSSKLELVIAQDRKIIKLNEVQRTPSELIGWFPTVLFTPADVMMAHHGPIARRKFLDGLMIQGDRQYLWSLANYWRALKQRNALLKNILYHGGSLGTLDTWDQQLIEFGSYIYRKRLDLIRTLNEQIAQKYRQLSGAEETITILQKLSVLTKESFARARPFDLRTGTTTVGSHHDDFILLLDGRPMAQFSSRGQLRTSIIALKILEGQAVFHQTGQRPVYLLDDIFSELDPAHRQLVIHCFDPSQAIYTTADVEHEWQKMANLAIIELGKEKEPQ